MTLQHTLTYSSSKHDLDTRVVGGEKTNIPLKGGNAMKIHMTALVGSVAAALVAGSASAVTYSAAQLAADGSNLYNTGTQVSGRDFTDLDKTVNGVDFDLNNAFLNNSAVSVIGNRNAGSTYFDATPDLDAAMDGIIFSSTFDITFSELTINESYVAQFMSWDAAVVGFGAAVDGRLQTISSTVDATTFDFQQGVSGSDRNPVVVTVEFVATDISETFTLAARDLNDNAILNAATLFVVPEPSSLALLGLGGLLIARRRRNA